MDYAGNYTLIPAASRFEFGTRALATFSGLEEALRFWDGLPWDRAFNWIDQLVAYTIERIDASSKLDLSSPRRPEHRSGIVTVRLPEGTDSLALYHKLREEDGILASPVRDERDFRLAVHCFNNRDDIDSAISVLERRV